MNKPTVQNPKQDKLAKTGAASEAAVIAIMALLIGTAACTVAWCAGRFGNDHI